jgi:CRP-like cAMP-binding protein
VIIIEGETGESAYIIVEGKVEITRSRNGETIHLAFRNKGEIFGEMSIIDEKPRSATVAAVTEPTVKEVQQNGHLETVQSDQESAVNLLKSFFHRLREASHQVLEFKAELGQTIAAEITSSKVRLSATLEGLTPRAVQTLPFHPLVIAEFPFRIGRLSDDQLTHNDLMIPDEKPFQLSRHHITIFQQNGRIGVSDRGSTLGAEVNGKRFGGRSHSIGPIFFEGGEGILVLGSPESPYRYKVTVNVQGA